MVSAAEQLAANLNFSAPRQGRGAEEAHLVHARRAAGLPLRHLHPAARHRSRPPGSRSSRPRPAASSACSTCSPAAASTAWRSSRLNIMPYISASIIIQLMTTVSPTLEQLEERGRAGPQGHQPVHPLSHRGAGGVPGLRHLDRARRRGRRGRRSGHVLPHLDRDHADRRHHVPDVARRADHRARHRQRHLADHHVRHRRANCRRRSPACSNSAARARCRPA